MLALHRPPDPELTPAQVDRNLRYLVGDIAWHGVLYGTMMAFLQVYIVRLGASSLLVGAITYGPALVAMLWLIPAGRLVTRIGHRMRWVIATGLLFRLVLLAIPLVPFFTTVHRAELTALIWVLSAVPANLSNLAFTSMMADAVPEDRRQQMVGLRIAAFGLVNTITTLLAGPLLQSMSFPINYQVLFLVGFAGTMVSWWQVTKIHVPDPPARAGKQPPLTLELGEMARYPGFLRFVAGVTVLQLALGMIAPLLPIYWVRTLNIADGPVSVIMSVTTGTMVIGSLAMRNLVRHIGRERALAIGGFGYALYPLLTSFTSQVGWLIAWAALAGLFNAAITVNLFDNLASVTPDANRTNYVAIYTAVVNVALFAGPVIAGVVADAPAAGPALGLRVAAGVGTAAGVLLVMRRRA